MNQEENFNGNNIKKMFAALLPAQILSTAATSLGGIINGLVIGNNLPASAMVALGFVVPLTAILGAIASVFSGGARIVCGQSMGRGDIKALDRIFSVTVHAIFTVGIALSLLMFFGASFLAGLCGADAASVSETASYIRGLALGVVPTLLVPSLMIFLQLGGESNYALLSTLVLAGANLVFALISVKLTDGGVFGMGAASSAGQLVAAIFLFVKFGINKKLMHFDISLALDRALLKSIVRLGSPTALAALLYALRNIVINTRALAVGGERAVSSLAILNSAMGPFDAINIGLGATTLILASVFVGERDERSFNYLIRHSVRTGLLLGGGKLAFLALAGKPLIALFGASQDIVALCYSLVLWYAVCMPVNMLILSITSPLQALGRVRTVNIILVFMAFVFPIACCYAAPVLFGITGIWMCYFVAEILGMLVFLVMSIKKNGHFPKRFSDLICLGDELGVGAKYCISVKNEREAINISEKIMSFCKENGIEHRRAMLGSLFIEEMACNVLKHGFADTDKKNCSVDIAVCIEDGRLLVRLRDNAPQFDPHQKFTPFDPSDPCKNIGIRMVLGMAKEASYQSSFGMNILNLEV